MLELSAADKRASAVHRHVIENTWQELMDIPVNDWFGWERFRRSTRRAARKAGRAVVDGLSRMAHPD
jgi:hypothetical protein